MRGGGKGASAQAPRRWCGGHSPGAEMDELIFSRNLVVNTVRTIFDWFLAGRGSADRRMCLACAWALARGLGYCGLVNGGGLDGRPGWAVGPPKRVESPGEPGDGSPKDRQGLTASNRRW